MLITLHTEAGNQIAVHHYTIGCVIANQRGTLIKSFSQGEGEPWYSEIVSESFEDVLAAIEAANRTERQNGSNFGI